MALITRTRPAAVPDASASARARISSSGGGGAPPSAASRTCPSVADSACLTSGRPKVPVARRPGSERRSASTEGMRRRGSGPVLHASGVAMDPRKDEPYAKYDEVEFDVPIGRNGDSYDRLWVLVQRMHESCAIIEQCMEKLPAGDYIAPKLPKTLKLEGETYVRTENPLGMMGYYVVGNGKKEPYRLKMRTPSFSNISVLPAILPGSLVPDLIALLGSIFFVVGDVDR